MNFMRKSVLASIVSAALLLTACGTATNNTSAANTGASAQASASGAVTTTTNPAPEAPAVDLDATRVITDANGKAIEVPANPQRIVALSETDLDVMLALGLKPIATISGRGQTATPRYLGDLPAGIPIVGTATQPTVEQVIEMDPDLILVGSLADEQVLAQLSALAPTVVTITSGEDWKIVMQRIANALNKEAEGKAWLAEYEKKVAEVREKLGPNANAEVSVVRWNSGGPIFMGQHLFTSQVLAEVGLKRPAHQADTGGQPHSPTLSLEMLNQIDGDWLFLGTLNPDADTALKAAMKTPAFQQLNVVKNNRVVMVDGTSWSSAQGPMAALSILETLEKELAVK